MTKQLTSAAFVLTLVLMTACFLSCGKNQNSGAAGKIKLGFIVKQPEEPWFQLEWKFADEASQKYGFDLVKIGAADGDRVLAAIDNLASQDAKGFVICTPDVKLGPAIANQAGQHDLKLIAVDDRFVNPDGKPME